MTTESQSHGSRLVKWNAPEDVQHELAGFAVLDDKTISGVVNDAVRFYVNERRSAPTFSDELAAARERIAQEASDQPQPPAA